MKTLAAVLATTLLLLGSATPSLANTTPFTLMPPVAFEQPQVIAKVSISSQMMDLVVVTGTGETFVYNWAVSTGRRGYETPTGSWSPTWLSKNHRSKTYDNAPMPHAVFFTGGYAVHGTEYVRNLGRVASHGCVRLAPENAATFFKLVQAYGKANTRIVITD